MGYTNDKVIGYSDFGDVNIPKLNRKISIIKSILSQYYMPCPDDIILVAGCGKGHEVILLHELFAMKTIGVDLCLHEEKILLETGNILSRQSLTDLKFEDNYFGLIYSYHVLEHITAYHKAIREMHRTLKKDGILFIGFPNKNRLIGYIGSHGNATLYDRLKWNLCDYAYRMRGEFDNRHGAHAGFTEEQFICITQDIFTSVHAVRNDYMLLKYPKFSFWINIAICLGLNEYIFPSNYYICVK